MCSQLWLDIHENLLLLRQCKLYSPTDMIWRMSFNQTHLFLAVPSGFKAIVKEDAKHIEKWHINQQFLCQLSDLAKYTMQCNIKWKGSWQQTCYTVLETNIDRLDLPFGWGTLKIHLPSVIFTHPERCTTFPKEISAMIHRAFSIYQEIPEIPVGM